MIKVGAFLSGAPLGPPYNSLSITISENLISQKKFLQYTNALAYSADTSIIPKIVFLNIKLGLDWEVLKHILQNFLRW